MQCNVVCPCTQIVVLLINRGYFLQVFIMIHILLIILFLASCNSTLIDAAQ